MKKIVTLFSLCIVFILTGLGVFAQGLETFTNYPETANAYHDGSFQGLDGSTWTYKQCRGDSVITAPTPTLGKNRTPVAEVTSGLLTNGMGTLSFDYKQVFSTNVGLNVMVNGVLLTTITTTGEQGILKNTGALAVNVPGTITLSFIQATTTSGQVAIDNVTWTAFGGGTPDPEPSNYPTAFTGTGAGLNIQTTWTDATGTQLPAAYLIKISKTDNITAPVDGTVVSDDLDLTDGTGAKNVMQGIHQYTFAGLQASTTYYLKIYPYTNAGSQIDYKTDGTAPASNARTQAMLYQQNFNNGLAPWTEFSVLGDQVWIIDSIHGIGGSICMKMTGFVSATSTVANEDWLISPSMVIPGGSSPKLEFYSAMNYGTGSAGIAVYVSTDYSSGDPSTSGTWTDLTSQAVFSAGGWAWTSSGFLDLSAYTGTNVHVAFKYTCDAISAPTWEVDDIFVTNNSGVGFADNSPSTDKASIYPNPCKDWFIAGFPTNDTYRVSVFTFQGTLLLEKEGCKSGTRIDASKMPTGSYLVSIENLNTHAKEMHKLIIK